MPFGTSAAEAKRLREAIHGLRDPSDYDAAHLLDAITDSLDRGAPRRDQLLRIRYLLHSAGFIITTEAIEAERLNAPKESPQ
jgi:hypothetical protein